MIKAGLTVAKAVAKGMKNSKKITGWKYLDRTEIGVSDLGVKTIKISGEKKNGLKVDFYIYKDKNGANIASQRVSSDGTTRTIRISRTESAQYASPGSKTLCDMFYDSNAKKYTIQTLDKNGHLIEDSHTYSEVFKMDEIVAKSYSPKQFKKLTGYDKPEDYDKVYQTVARVKKTANKDGGFDVQQEVLQLKNSDSYQKSSLNIKSTMTEDGEMILKNIESSANVDMDITNPYFQSVLLRTEDFLRSSYQNIVKERGLKGVEPPLLFNTNSKVFENVRYKFQAAGVAPRDNSYVGINLWKVPNRNRLTSILGHECEHVFTQHANVHLAGLNNLKSDNPISIKFYDFIEKKFGKILPDTDEYNKAEKYNYEMLNYKKIVFDEKGHLNHKGHASLSMENDADLAGQFEATKFRECVDDYVANFQLLNRNWFDTVADLG